MKLSALVLSMLYLLSASGQKEHDAVCDDPSRGALRLMWYNVENLFHPGDESIPGDDEFTPQGLRHWTNDRYRNKLTGIAKVIIAAGAWDPPDLVGLCEVENAMVLEALVRHPILESYGYRFVHRDSPDRRGMDVACLYREQRFRPIVFEVHPSIDVRNEGTRDVLHICGVWGKRDTLDLFLVHFISKYSGAGATAESRRRQASHLAHLADSVHQHRKESLQIMAGDFNEEKDGYSMEPLLMTCPGRDSVISIPLGGTLGSYKYRGRWSSIDQFLVYGQVTQYRLAGSVLELPLLLTRDETYGGLKPNRTYTGYLFNGGISDHLPILLDISHRPFAIHSEH
jgi:hypothetical protein